MAPPSDFGSARTRCGPCIIAPGSFRAIHRLPARRAASSIFTSAVGKVQRWGHAITFSALTRRTSIQARRRKHHSLPPAPRRPIYVEHEYARAGALAYLAAWDVHRAKLFGRCERKNGIAAFERLVAQVMGQEPYRSAGRVFFITDNGSSHRGRRAAARLRARWTNIILVHTPIHASWLNQIEVYFSIVQRKILTPGDFADLTALKRGLIAFQRRYQRSAKPFKWTFTRRDLHALLVKLKSHNAAPHRKMRSRNTSP